MELDKLTEEAAQKHVTRSMEEMKSGQIETWTSGTRAQEQAQEIAQQLVQEALKVIEQGEKPNAG